MRAIPNMIVLVPSDAQRGRCLPAARRSHLDVAGADLCPARAGARNSSIQRRTRRSRSAAPMQLRDGSDIAILANGAMVFEALLAADALRSRGIGARVIDVHTRQAHRRQVHPRRRARCRSRHCDRGALGARWARQRSARMPRGSSRGACSAYSASPMSSRRSARRTPCAPPWACRLKTSSPTRSTCWAGEQTPSGGPAMIRLSANLGFMWPDRPLLERIAAAGRAGFKAIELHWPYDVEADRIACCVQGGGRPPPGPQHAAR